MSHDSTKKTIGVALGVCLVCSILVSSTAVSLGPIQEENKKVDKIKNILVWEAFAATPSRYYPQNCLIIYHLV